MAIVKVQLPTAARRIHGTAPIAFLSKYEMSVPHKSGAIKRAKDVALMAEELTKVRYFALVAL